MSRGLEIRALVVERSGSTIVRGVDMLVPPGEVTLLLGANGAGKTTLLEAISGLIPTAGGEALLDGTPVTKASRVRRSRNGLCHLEQGRTVFGDLTVAENVQAVARDPGAGSDALAMFPELEPRLGLAAASLSGGEQQMLAIARALATKPSLLLVDEMSLGLAPVIVHRLMPIFRTLANDGMAVLLVEQYADLAMRIGDRAYVLSRGTIALQGDSADLLQRPEDMRRAYLGGASDAGPAVGGINAAAAG
jgi:branched-chain amino acid transport system ATP-binding protein